MKIINLDPRDRIIREQMALFSVEHLEEILEKELDRDEDVGSYESLFGLWMSECENHFPGATRIVVSGTRNDEGVILEPFYERLQEHIKGKQAIVISGGATGIDYFTQLACVASETPHFSLPACWNTYGHRAGSYRNQEMIDIFQPHLCLAFPVIDSVGTFDMIHRCKQKEIKTIIERLDYE